MLIQRILGCTRVCGQSQGYLGLPIRDTLVNDTVNGIVPAMKTAWEPTPNELAALNAGGMVVVQILGKTPAPMMLGVELDGVKVE